MNAVGRSARTLVAAALVVLAPATVSATAPGPTIVPADTTEPAPTTAPAGDAATERSGPSITLDRIEMRIGDPVIVTLTGFSSQQVTVAVCGNLAKRGSQDCNMPQAQSERIRPDEPETLTQLFVETPPMPCPCIVRALGGDGEFAIAPIDLLDHPVAPVVSPELGPLVEVGISASRVPPNLSGRIRTGLGGATLYAVTVSVRNITTETLDGVVVRARVASRLGDDAAPMRFDTPGPIEPGQTWTQTIETKLSAPHMGTFTWKVSASGAGPIVDDTYVNDAVPAILYSFVALLLLDVVVLLVRMVRRRRRARRAVRMRAQARRSAETEAPEDTILHDDRPEPVGVG